MRSASQRQRQRRQMTISASCAGWSRARTLSFRAATSAYARRALPPSASSAQCAVGLRWVCAGFLHDEVCMALLYALCLRSLVHDTCRIY